MTTVPIILTFDNNYVAVSAVFIQSLAVNKRPSSEYKIYVVGDSIHPVEKRRLQALVHAFEGISIYFIDASGDSFSIGLNPNRHSTASTFFRLKLASMFPTFDRVLYLDTDMICNVDLSELMDMDISNVYYAAALDLNHVQGVHRGHWQREYYIGSLGWPEEHLIRYKQAGVMLFNLSRIRAHGIEAKFLDLVSRNFRMMDQDIVNIAVPVDEVLELEPRWNLLTAYGTFKSNNRDLPTELYAAYQDAFDDPCIVHFGGPKKPWNSNGDGPSLHHLFWKYAQQTEFYTHLVLKTAQNISAASPPSTSVIKKAAK